MYIEKLTGNITGTLIGRDFKLNFVSRTLIFFLEAYTGKSMQIDVCAPTLPVVV